KGECFLPVDRVTTGRSRPGKVSYALACFIFRFLRCPLEAKESGSDPYAAIEAVIPWDEFTESVSEAELLARPE
ncbi:hypothetical protein, partial [Escherichia coli]|uniref:hypothetical protein n=1 Tax=Escherichia coli TaxID=562 RepID=UPI001D0BF5EA